MPEKALIMVAGYVAGGKTTFSIKLSEQLGIPVFNKDLVKAVLGQYLPIPDRATSKRLSHATFGLITHTAENLMKAGVPFIWESNFAGDELEVLRGLLNRYAYRSLSFVFVGDLRVIHRRFTERELTPERDPANRMLGGELDGYEAFAQAIGPLGEFNVGDTVVRIDTTDFDAVDFTSHMESAKRFLHGEGFFRG